MYRGHVRGRPARSRPHRGPRRATGRSTRPRRIVAGTYAAARAAVDVALTTVDLVLGGESAAYGLCRPPGHHAARAMYGGYCYFNNAAIAAEAIARRTGEPVAILDVDYHHGNGTEQIFWRRGDVLYVSLHAHRTASTRTSWAGPTRSGRGRAPARTSTSRCRRRRPTRATSRRSTGASTRIAGRPGVVLVVSLGFDTYGLDPIGDFALTTGVYHEVGRRVAALGRRLVILQEGGYYLPALGDNARAWLRGAEGRPFDPLPAQGFNAGGTRA